VISRYHDTTSWWRLADRIPLSSENVNHSFHCPPYSLRPGMILSIIFFPKDVRLDVTGVFQFATGASGSLFWLSLQHFWNQDGPNHYYRAALNAGQSSHEKAVCLTVRLSVCPSVKRVDCHKTEKRSIQIFMPYKRSFSLVFWEEEWLVGAMSSTWNFGSNRPRWSKNTDFSRYSIIAPQR